MPRRTRTHKKDKQKDKQKHSRTFKKLTCAPQKRDKLKFTCYTSDGLEKMRELWNARHPDRPIHSNDPKIIWEHLKQYMNSCCSNEACWLRQNFIKHNVDKNLLHYTFAPKSPEQWKKNPNEWLSSVDILNVMKQYERVYSRFEFLGPSPIDYDKHVLYGDCVWEELCNFDLKQYMERSINKIGVVFNLDPHYKDGSHWVALYINISKQQIIFFDSYGHSPHRQIKKFMSRVAKQGKTMNMKFTQESGKRRHQYGESECGMYCLYFIITLLKGNSFDSLEKKKIPDKTMLRLRKRYFTQM